MELELIEFSQWGPILSAVGIVTGLLVVAGSFTAMIHREKPTLAIILIIAGIAITGGSGFVNGAIDEDQATQQEANFSQHLKEEYNATSSRTLADLRKDFNEYNEAPTVLTRDGQETPVFVKNISDDGKKLTMIFTVLDEKALYPKGK